MASFDHSVIRNVVTQDTTHDYAAVMEYCKNTDNWFKRARGEWDELQRQELGSQDQR